MNSVNSYCHNNKDCNPNEGIPCFVGFIAHDGTSVAAPAEATMYAATVGPVKSNNCWSYNDAGTFTCNDAGTYLFECYYQVTTSDPANFIIRTVDPTTASVTGVYNYIHDGATEPLRVVNTASYRVAAEVGETFTPGGTPGTEELQFIDFNTQPFVRITKLSNDVIELGGPGGV